MQNKMFRIASRLAISFPSDNNQSQNAKDDASKDKTVGWCNGGLVLSRKESWSNDKTREREAWGGFVM